MVLQVYARVVVVVVEPEVQAVADQGERFGYQVSLVPVTLQPSLEEQEEVWGDH